MTTTIRRLIAAAVTTALAVLCLAAPAPAAATGTIRGTVTDTDGKPLAGRTVKLVRTLYDHADHQVEAQVMTGADGTYRATGLPIPPDPEDGYLVEARDSRGDYVPVEKSQQLASGQTATVDLTMQRAGRISGTVVRPSGAVTDVVVGVGSVDFDTEYGSGSDRVGADGRFSIGGLPAGEYVVLYKDRAGVYLPQCYHEIAPDWSTNEPYCGPGSGSRPTTVQVVAGQTTTLEKETLKLPAAALSGTVTDATGKPIDVRGEKVNPRRQGEEFDPTPTVSGTSKGAFSIRGLRPGSWTVRTELSSTVWENRYLGGTTSLSKARFVQLSYGQRATANITLRTMPKITYTASSPAKGYAAFSVKVLKANNGKPAWGDATVTIGGQTKKATLKDGKASFRFKGLTTGKNAFKIANLGNSYTANGGKRSTVTVT